MAGSPGTRGLALGLAMTACSAAAGAIGLGEARVLTRLGEPLRLEVPVIIGNGERAGDVDASVVGGPGTIPVTGLVAEVLEAADGVPSRVLVSTRDTHREPVVVFRLRLRSSSTAIERDYTLLVDPPAIAAPRPRGAIVPGVANAAGTRIGPTAARRAPAAPGPVLPAFARTVRAPADGTLFGPVLPGDTLYRISTALAAQHGVDQARLANAIVTANPRAFPGGRPERLLAGAMLAIPLSAQALARSAPPPARPPRAPAPDAASAAPPIEARQTVPATAASPSATAVASTAIVAAPTDAPADSLGDLRARIAATREAIAAEEVRRSELNARLERANARIEELLASQDALDRRQRELADAVAAIGSAPAAVGGASTPAPQAGSVAAPPAAATNGSATPQAPPVATPAGSTPAVAASASAVNAAVIARASAPPSLAALGVLPRWLGTREMFAAALVLLLILLGVGYARWRARRVAATLERYNDESIEATMQRIASVLDNVNREVAPGNVVELDEERSRRAASG